MDATRRARLEQLVHGGTGRPRFLQPAPVQPEVWFAYAAADEPQTLLLRPRHGVSAAELARALAPIRPARLSHVPGLVLAALTFEQFLAHVLPMTRWWTELPGIAAWDLTDIALQLEFKPDAVATLADEARSGRDGPPADLAWLATLAGAILSKRWSRRGGDALPARRAAAAAFAAAMQQVVVPPEPLVFRIALDREVGHAGAQPKSCTLESARTIKADAARRLFDIRCDDIVWAVVDTGIAPIPAFDDGAAEPRSRVVATYDLTRIAGLTSLTGADADTIDLVAREGRARGVADPDAWARERLSELAPPGRSEDAADARDHDWTLLEPLLRVHAPEIPRHSHGTQVASIIGARRADGSAFEGLCPDIRLIDVRVFRVGADGRPVASEFEVIGALQLIRHIKRVGTRKVHGVNLSLSVRHDVYSYACGATLVCEECDAAACSGLVVVAAAGNEGYQRFMVDRDARAPGSLGAYADGTITDPGNAAGAITVGATHATDPHKFGVSYFSSRGPTGDGRAKPDLLAPGERVCGLDQFGGTVQDVGTSFAAPHVSAAAAMLLARAPELQGRPGRVKEILTKTATDLGRVRSFQGAGLVDALRALQFE